MKIGLVILRVILLAMSMFGAYTLLKLIQPELPSSGFFLAGWFFGVSLAAVLDGLFKPR